MPALTFAQDQDARVFAESIVNTVREPLLVLDDHLRVVTANHSFYRIFKVSEQETVGQLIYQIGNGQWDIPKLRELLETIIPQNTQFHDFEVEHDFPCIGLKYMLLNARRISQEGERGELILLAIEDVTERMLIRHALEESEKKYHKFVENLNSIIIGFDTAGRITFFNRFAEKLFGYRREEVIGRDFLGTIIPRRESTGKDNGGLVADTIRHPEKHYINENEGLRKNGERIWFSWSARDARDRNGIVKEILIDGTDLTAERERYRLAREAYTLLENTPDLAVRFDVDRKYLFANKAAAELVRRPKEQIIGRTLGELGSPQQTAETLTRAFNDALRTKQVQKFEAKYGNRYFETMMVPELTDTGDIMSFMMFGRENTEAKKTESVLRRERELLQTLINTIPVMITIYDPDTLQFLVNRQLERVTGWTNEDFQRVNPMEAVYPDPEYRQMVTAYVRSLTPGFKDLVMTAKDGSRIETLWANVKLPDGRQVGIGLDISERKKAEKRLDELRKTAERRANESEEGRRILEAIMEYIPEGLLIVDAETKRLRMASKYIADYMGVQRGQMQGMSLRDYSEYLKITDPSGRLMNPDDIPVSRALVYGRNVTDEEYVLTRKNGEMVNVLINAVPIRDMKGEITGAVASWRDISERKRTEDALRRNEYELRTLVDNSPDLIFRLNRRMQYVYANPAYERLTGIPKNRLIASTNRELGMSPQMVEFWESTARAVLENGQERSVEFELTSFFGKRYFFARVVPEYAKTGLVETMLVIARDITERKRAEERIRYISFHDEVTGLFNRAFFEEEIRRVDTERDLPVSIIMGDVNNLKLSNDVFGHEEGDRLLKTIANSIRKACRQSDIVARWGGDEFAVILPGTDRATAEELCNRIGQIAGESKGTVIRPSIAVGLAAKEQRGQNIYQTIRQAEQDMYDYKIIHAGENEGEVFSSLLARVRDRVTGYGGHLDRSRELGRRFGSEAGLNEELAKDLDLLIEMHDIGKAILPRETLAKPGPLTHEEWDVMKKHSEAGFRIVKTFADTAKISDDVLSHAEHWDGSGYPRGLKGKEIPYLCRIFQIVDAFDVMTHPRTYARYLTQEEALAELRRNAGKQFDPELTEAFIWMVTGGAEAKAPV